MDHPTHRLNFYQEDRKKIVYCSVCSREETQLSAPCPGKYVPLSMEQNNTKIVDKSVDTTK